MSAHKVTTIAKMKEKQSLGAGVKICKLPNAPSGEEIDDEAKV